MPENVVASAGTGGVGICCTILWEYLMITESVTTRPESAASLIGPITLGVKLTEKA
jgi:hypothetical protein